MSSYFILANKIQLYIVNYLKYTILQFLQDIFDALFAILNEGAEQYGNLVFEALVSAYKLFTLIIINSPGDQLLIGLIAQLIKHSAVVAEAVGLTP